MPVIDPLNKMMVNESRDELKAGNCWFLPEMCSVDTVIIFNFRKRVTDHRCQGKWGAPFEEGLPVANIELQVIIIDVAGQLNEIIEQVGHFPAVYFDCFRQKFIHDPLPLACTGVILKRMNEAIAVKHGI